MGTKWLRLLLLLVLFGVLSTGLYYVIANDLLKVNINQDEPLAAKQNGKQIEVAVVVEAAEKPQQYEVEIESGVMAIDVLAKLDERDDFSFEFSEDPSFGVYPKAFNGVKAQENEFWQFQVNGQSSNLGVSSYEVKNGDELSFNLETF